MQRDLRLDFFRGVALILIFIDHVPENVLSWFTLQAVGFYDAAEVFIFISGFTAALVYGRRLAAKGEPKLLHRCNLPLTGAGVVDMVVTDLGVFTIDRKGGGMELIEIAPGVSLDEIQAQTEALFRVRSGLE